VLVDDEVAASEWEQELYRMGVPPQMEVIFDTVAEAIAAMPKYRGDPRRGILLTPDIDTMQRLVSAGVVEAVNVGGVHHRPGRAQKLRYVFLTPEEEAALRAMGATGVPVAAQDVPAAESVALSDLLAGGS
jgi:mannose/fructose/N-acetylgalactosamine-specific phosphotransferase system component IIB